MKFNILDWIALLLVVIGGLIWGLIGLFNFDLVALIFGEMTLLARIVYIVIGLSAVYLVYMVGTKGKMKKE